VYHGVLLREGLSWRCGVQETAYKLGVSTRMTFRDKSRVKRVALESNIGFLSPYPFCLSGTGSPRSFTTNDRHRDFP
jgi:hypothetical protein